MKTNPLTYESMAVGQRYRNSMINLAPPELPEKNLKITSELNRKCFFIQDYYKREERLNLILNKTGVVGDF